MKTFLIALLISSVSFLAVCRAAKDEFADFEEELSLADSNPKPIVKNTSLIVTKAQEHFDKKEYDKTTTLLWQNIEKIDRSGMILLAHAHEQKKEPDQMVKVLTMLISKNPKDFEAHALLGSAYAIKNKKPDMLESYKAALEINSKYEPAYIGLIKYYEEKNNYYELRALYQDMIDKIGAKPTYLAKLCEVNTKDHTFEAAIRVCKDAIKKDNNIADNYVYLGLSQKGTDDDKGALITFKNAAARFPKSEFALFTYAKELEEAKNYVESFKYYKAAASAQDTSARAWLGIGMTSMELQKLDIALVGFKKACKFDRKNAAAFRKASAQLIGSKNMEWSKKFSDASEQCSYGN